MNIKVKVRKVCKNAVLPRYAHEGDAGMDLFSCENSVVKAGDRMLVSSGVAMEFEAGYFASIRGKSGLAYKKGISILGGVVEYTYRGEYKVIILNSGDEDFEVRAGDKIAQVVIAPVVSAEVVEVEELEESVRGAKGFGSSGGTNV